MIDTSSLTFSAGRVETNSQAGSRGRFGGEVLELVGLARAKQTFLPPGLAVYAPHSPYCPSKVGCAAPGIDGAAGAAVAGGFGAAGFGGVAGAAGAGFAAGGCCCAEAAPEKTMLPATTAPAARAIRCPQVVWENIISPQVMSCSPEERPESN